MPQPVPLPNAGKGWGKVRGRDFQEPKTRDWSFGWGWRAAILLLPMLSACAYLPQSLSTVWQPAPSGPHLAALDASACRRVLHDDTTTTSLQHAAARSIDYLQRLPPDRTVRAVDRQVTAGALLTQLGEFHNAAGPVGEYICAHFRLYRAVMQQPLLVTGYYQPELAASRVRTDRFRYPLYRVPDDLVDVKLGEWCAACRGRVAHGRVRDGTLVPYYSRAEIDAGALAGHGYEIAWLDDPVEAFFLHIQGSALLRFADGVHMQISYNGSNGRPYTSLGRTLIRQGKMARSGVTLAALKGYLRSHPGEQQSLMAANERYIFFRPVVAGPIGSLGVPLTDGRSIAADPAVYPPGALAFLRIEGSDAPSAPAVSRLVLIQDAGVAITGTSRVDVYWGTGAPAEAIAGSMQNPGELYLVLPE